MKRKAFLNKLALSVGAVGLAPVMLPKALKGEPSSTYDKLRQNLGYNHLPNKEIRTMDTILHKADSRGNANHGWLNSYHTFSFANYHNPERMHFGVLRVLNDDTVAPGQGFGTHPHDNMEIVSIPLEGDLEHKDSMGNTAVIQQGDVQVMSAGTGIYHSEFNKNKDKAVKFLQIWVFPNKKGIKPRYDQISTRTIRKNNEFYQILSPSPDDQGVSVQQDAWFHLGDFKDRTQTNYKWKKSGNGLYVFVLEGSVTVDGQELEKRDGFGIWNTEATSIQAEANSRVLLLEVPMSI